MSDSDNPIPASVPDRAVQSIRDARPDQPVIVDLDETLLLRNSTSEYLDALRPSMLGAMYLVVADRIGSRLPPHWTDWFRAFVATLIFPWTLWRWQRTAKRLGEAQVNPALKAALLARKPEALVISTLGFAWIVKPIVAAMGLPPHQLIACRSGADRKRGKLAMLTDAGIDVDASIVITDSLDDAPLLRRCAEPHLITWPDSACVVPLQYAYFPMRYAEKAKRPGYPYFWRVIIRDDLVVIWLACTWISPTPLLHGLAMLLLTLSFWCTYEIGYVENDRVGAKYENDPVLSATFQEYGAHFPRVLPWFIAMLIAAPGLALITTGPANWAGKMGMWLLLLAATRVVYVAHNYLHKPSRIWTFSPLQAAKTYGFLLVTTTNVIGAALFFVQVISRWLPYLVRRWGGRRDFPDVFARTLMFVLLMPTIALAAGMPELLWSGQTLVVIAWLLFRARHYLRDEIKNAKPVKATG